MNLVIVRELIMGIFNFFYIGHNDHVT